MKFIANLLTFFTFAVIVLLSLWQNARHNLEAEKSEKYDLRSENYNLKKKIDDLKEELSVVKKAYDSLEADREELIKELTEKPEENNSLNKECV